MYSGLSHSRPPMAWYFISPFGLIKKVVGKPRGFQTSVTRPSTSIKLFSSTSIALKNSKIVEYRKNKRPFSLRPLVVHSQRAAIHPNSQLHSR